MSSAEEVIVKTSKGSLRGKRVPSARGGTYFSFQGIPYGKAPIGDLRFKAPVEAEPWTGVRDALKEGAIAPSFSMITKEYEEDSSEDCLFLNVYTPQVPFNGSEPLRAVLFWIHGGGFYSGSGNSDFYSADYLVPENVVVVTCNYRLGPLGFLSLQNSDCPGNNGLKDILLALKWCQGNISAFGGDPKNVTIFGESAGGAAVHYLTLTKKSEGLFHKAIAQSGVAISPWGIATKPKECAFALGKAMGCNTTNEKELLKFLKGVPPKDLITSAKKILKTVEAHECYLENGFVPCVEPETEDALITKHPDEIYKAGEARSIPFMLGGNTLEGLIIVKASEIHKFNPDKDIENLIPKNLNIQRGSRTAQEIADKIKSYYFPNGFDSKSYVNALSRIYFLNGINQVIESLAEVSSKTTPTYVYHFIYDGNVTTIKQFIGFSDWKGTCHADELVYLFRQTLFNATIEKGTKEYSMMETMTKLWTDFAKTGNPTPQNSKWTPINKNNLPYMEIGEVLTEKSDLGREEFEFWKSVHKMACQTQKNCKL